MSDKVNDEAVKRIAAEMVVLGRGQSLGVLVAAFSLAVGVVAKNCETPKKRDELIDRVAALAKEAARTK